MENQADRESDQFRHEVLDPAQGGEPFAPPDEALPDRVQINEIDDLSMAMRGTESVGDAAGTARVPAAGLIITLIAIVAVIVLLLPIVWAIAMVAGVVAASLPPGVVLAWAIVAALVMVAGVLVGIGVFRQV